MEADHASFCRICAAACGIIVSTDDQRVVRVRGDSEHPISRGYVCSKARGLPEWHHRAERLDRPRLQGIDVGWDELLDDLADRLKSTIAGDVDGGGANAVAMYLATGLAYDAGGQVAAGLWMRGLGSSSFYSAATVDNAPILVAAELVTGNPMLNPVWNPEEPGLLILVGTNPVVSHGYGTTLPDPVRRLRDFRGAGGRIWVVDPRRTESAALADHHIPIRPGADVVLLAAMARELLTDFDPATELCTIEDIEALRTALAPFTIESAASIADIDAGDVSALVADLRLHHGRLAMFCGTGTTMAADGILTEWLRWVLLILTGSLDRPGGMRFNRGVVNQQRPVRPGPAAATAPGPISRPELPRVAGQMPAVALVDEIEAGRVRVLVVTGGNLLTALPDPDRVRAALGSLDAFVVVDVMDSEMARLATHVLPATGQLERADLSLAEHVSIRSGIQSTRAVVDPVADRRPVWWMLAQLSARIGTELLPGLAPDASTDETFLSGLLAHSPLDGGDVFAAGPRGIDVPIEFGWVRATMLPRGVWGIAPPQMLSRLVSHRPPNATGFVMTPRREMAWSNSVRFGIEREPSVLRLHSTDVANLGLIEGEQATVASAHGSVSARVTIDDNVRRGVASLTHGDATQGPGNLTSGREGVDPLTTMPHASGLAVTVSRQ
jgi:anaerobic selenocysteine-containing dehydrogenase